MRYLLVISNLCSLTIETLKERLEPNVLYSYCARNWGHHARMSSIEEGKLIPDLLENTAKVSACSQAMIYDKYEESDETQMIGNAVIE
jgi:hypothetical protein